MIWPILLFALGIRLISLNQSLWMDEAITALAVKGNSFWSLVVKFPLGDTHPPLYYLLLKAWTNLFGYSEISLRVPSVILGTAVVYIVYLIGKKIDGEKLGVISALFLATSGLHIYYSQEVRMYALSALAASLLILFFLKTLNKAGFSDWLFLSLSILLVGITDYLPLLVIAALWIYGLVSKRTKSWWRKFLLVHAPLAIFILLWLPIFRAQAVGTKNYLQIFSAWADMLGQASAKALMLVWVKFILGRISFTPKFVYGLVLVIASAPFIAGLIGSIKKNKEVLIIWLWLIVPLIIAFVGSIFIPGFSYFRMIFALPAFYVLVAFGLSQTRFGYVLTATIILLNLIFSGTYLFNRNFWREDWKSAVSFLDRSVKGDERVIMVYPEPFAPYQWYAKRDLMLRADSVPGGSALYTLDYLMDLTDPERTLFTKLKSLDFQQTEVYSFRGVGQIRYWRKK